MTLEKLVPPIDLCKHIPTGEFADSCFVRCFDDIGTVILCERENEVKTEGWHTIPAPTLDEILDELHKCQEDVFIKWSETAYHEWLVNAYSHNKDDFQAHDKNSATAALKVWLKLKGIEND